MDPTNWSNKAQPTPALTLTGKHPWGILFSIIPFILLKINTSRCNMWCEREKLDSIVSKSNCYTLYYLHY